MVTQIVGAQCDQLHLPGDDQIGLPTINEKHPGDETEVSASAGREFSAALTGTYQLSAKGLPLLPALRVQMVRISMTAI